MKVLVTGSSGAGKTYLTGKFKEIGINAYDSDLIPNLDSWYYKGDKVKTPELIDQEFLDNHSFLWDRKVLEKFLEDNPDVIIFGMSGNAFTMLGLFDKIYFLQVPWNIIEQRVQHESRLNPMGKTEVQRKAAVEWGAKKEQEAKELGIEFIDGTLPFEEIVEVIKLK